MLSYTFARRRLLTGSVVWDLSFKVSSATDSTTPSVDVYAAHVTSSLSESSFATAVSQNVNSTSVDVSTLTVEGVTKPPTSEPTPSPTAPDIYVSAPAAGAAFSCGSDITITWKTTGSALAECVDVDIRLYENSSSITSSFKASIELDYPNGQNPTYVWSTGTQYCGKAWKVRVSCATSLSYLDYSGDFSIYGLPTSAPTSLPTLSPSLLPTSLPSIQPTLLPTALPTLSPTALPSQGPSLSPTSLPTMVPSHGPTMIPTSMPTDSFIQVLEPLTGQAYLCSDMVVLKWKLGSQLGSTCTSAHIWVSKNGGTFTTVKTNYPIVPSSSGIYSYNFTASSASTTPTCGDSNDLFRVQVLCGSSSYYTENSGSFSVVLAPTLSPTSLPSHIPTLLPSPLPTMLPSNEPTLVPSQAPTVSSKPTPQPSTFPTDNAPSRISLSAPRTQPSYSCGDPVTMSWITTGSAVQACGTVDLYIYNNATHGSAPVPIISGLLNDVSNTFAWTSTSAYCGGEWKIRIYCTLLYSDYTPSFSIRSAPTSKPTATPTTQTPTRLPTPVPTLEPTPVPTAKDEDDWMGNNLSVAGIPGMYVGSICAGFLLLCCSLSLIRVHRMSKTHREELQKLRGASDRGSDHVDLEMVERGLDYERDAHGSTGSYYPRHSPPGRSPHRHAEFPGHYGNHVERMSPQATRKPAPVPRGKVKPPKPPKPQKLIDDMRRREQYQDGDYESESDDYTSDSDGETVSTDKDFSHWSREHDAGDGEDAHDQHHQHYQHNPLQHSRRHP